ncbi:hypothetical protein [Limnoglobus roseus]|uniref:Uncharacterized protein n=1 Tax=Limnoglobus roseus TaxID=2598579 RepID=A0A5C1AM81_9BACT|nr:hypothetical protein [Limnoglobus roseus]QEL19685.1 hypothetical protein PX52LOC_06764 [Limnoglobus roseus]
MTRSKLVVAILVVAGLAAWTVFRTGKTAGAAESQAAVVETYGDNTEEVAQHRWQTNAPRHWRALMVKR